LARFKELNMEKIVVGRHKEKEKLTDALSSHRSELIAVYGRRRIGKTYLIREFYAKNMVLSVTGLSEANKTRQIKNFAMKLNEVYGEFQTAKYPSDWLEVFARVKQYLESLRKTTKKKVLFIDEFPWFDSQRSGFLAAFENFWNDYCTTRQDLVVVICGSAASYMVKNIIFNKRGLNKRITKTIKLNPFNLQETQAFFQYKKMPIEKMELLKIYMAFGGIAEYLENIQKGESSVLAIDRMCFQDGAYLENEFEEVFKSLFEENSYHHQIMIALSKNNKRGIRREILLQELQISSGGRFSDALDDLIHSGFVLKYQAYSSNRKITLYKIYDEFCLFYLQFMKKYKGSKWTEIYQKQEYISWCGYAFETICLKHSLALKKGLKCDQIRSENYAWSNANAQIDLVIDRDDNIVDLCEIKFSNDEISIDEEYLRKLRKKENEFRASTRTKKSIQTILISTWGVKENQYSSAIVTKNLTVDCLFLQNE
jgi:AAA+ ATPase superfamily predicted ATPase